MAASQKPSGRDYVDARRRLAVRETRWVAILSLVQFTCAGFFVSEFLTEVLGLRRWAIPFELRELLQILASLGLVLGTVSSMLLLKKSRRKLDLIQRQLAVASGAFFDVLEEFFDEWSLSPSERDVALFAIKGCTNGEIAGLRGKSEATIKTQMNAVFRKADVSGRAQLLSLFIDALISQSSVKTP